MDSAQWIQPRLNPSGKGVGASMAAALPDAGSAASSLLRGPHVERARCWAGSDGHTADRMPCRSLRTHARYLRALPASLLARLLTACQDCALDSSVRGQAATSKARCVPGTAVPGSPAGTPPPTDANAVAWSQGCCQYVPKHPYVRFVCLACSAERASPPCIAKPLLAHPAVPAAALHSVAAART